jgi:carbamate kinase
MITPTPYPDDPASAFIVHGYLQVDRRSEEFRALNTKLDTVLEELRKSNEISGVLREQLVSEIEAGRRILESPRPDRGLVKVLLVHSLRWIIAAAGGGIVGTHADEALSNADAVLTPRATYPDVRLAVSSPRCPKALHIGRRSRKSRAPRQTVL